MPNNENDRYIEPLTARQQEILALLAEGCSTKGIAMKLFISKVTARNHIGAIMKKLGAHSRLEAVAVARRLVADPGGRLIHLGNKDGMDLTAGQKGGIRLAFVPVPVPVVPVPLPLPVQPVSPVMESIMESVTVTMSSQQKFGSDQSGRPI